MERIENEQLIVEVSPCGAEVQSIKDKLSDREFLWQGDARWWSGRSPILFPIVGGLWNGVCRLDNLEMRIPKHGFVRKAHFMVGEKDGQHLRFEIFESDETLKIFPFPFLLSVTYKLEGRKLSAEIAVENTGSETLLFQAGGHPGISLPDFSEEDEVDGFLQLEGNPAYIWRAGDQGCLEPRTLPVPYDSDGLIPLSVKTFEHEALIFDKFQVKAATILDKQKQRVARVESDSPVWLFWSPCGKHSPFVCAEPWFGLCDHQGFEGQMDARPFINSALPGQTWRGHYSVEV